MIKRIPKLVAAAALAVGLVIPRLAGVPARADDGLDEVEQASRDAFREQTRADLQGVLAQLRRRAKATPSIAPGAPAQSAAPVTIVIYHTNDIHGSIGPVAADAQSGRGASGGAASLATLLKRETRPYLWIDSGDWFQGTPEGNIAVSSGGPHGEAVIEVLNRLKLSASVLGNHDYDYGEENVKKLAAKAAFPILGANIASTVAGQSVSYARGSVVFEPRPGIFVGVFGLLTHSMTALAFPENIQGLNFGRESDAAAAAVADLKKRGAGVVIAATHLGIEQYGGKTYDGIKEGDLFLANNVPGIDLILGGHTHTEMATPVSVTANGHQTLITQTRGLLSSVYQIVLSVDPKSGAVLRSDAKLIALDPAVYPPDPDIEKLVAGDQALVAQQMSKPVGSSSAAIAKASDANGESAIGEWVADVLRAHGGTQIGLINTFGARAELPVGALTYGHLYRVMPFDNHYMKLELSGSELRKLVEQNLGADTVYLQYSGLEIAYDPKAEAGKRLKSLKVGGAAARDDLTYTVATMDFVATVDKAFKGIQKRVVESSSLLVRDLLVSEVARNSPIAPPASGRLRRQQP